MKAYLVALAVFLLAAAAVWQQQKIIDQQALQVDDLEHVANDSGRMAKVYRNMYGQEISKNSVLRMDIKVEKDLRKTSELKWLERFEGLKKNGSNLESATKLDAEATFDLSLAWDNAGGSNNLVLHDWPDSLALSGSGSFDFANPPRPFYYEDPFNTLLGELTTDSVKVSGSIKVPIKGVVYWQRQRILGLRIGRKKYFSEFTCDNPWVSILGHEVITIRKK